MTLSKNRLEGLTIAEVAAEFDVSERTARRWLGEHGLYQPRSGYGPGKLSAADSREIQRARQAGVSAKELASQYGVTLATIYRTAKKKTNQNDRDTAVVSVIYNPKI